MAPRLKPKKSQIPNFAKLAEKIAKDGRRIADEQMAAFAAAEVVRFKAAIAGQHFASFKAFPLSARTLKEKSEKKLDLRVMIATKTYLDSIKVMRTILPNGGIRYHIGFSPTALAKNYDGEITGITLNEVAYIQEHGSKAAHIPARPHWRPHLQAMALRATVIRARILAATTKLAKQRLKGP